MVAKPKGKLRKNKKSNVSAHYIVDQHGFIVQCVREADTAYANGRVEKGADPWWNEKLNPNWLSITIELVKSLKDNSNNLTSKQESRTFGLIESILTRHPNIKIGWADASGGITGHFSISPKTKLRCPGPFCWEKMFQYVRPLRPPVPPTCVVTPKVDNLDLFSFQDGSYITTLRRGHNITIYNLQFSYSGAGIFTFTHIGGHYYHGGDDGIFGFTKADPENWEEDLSLISLYRCGKNQTLCSCSEFKCMKEKCK